MLQTLENRLHIPSYFLWILSYYLEDRTLLYETRVGQCKMKATSGLAQRSIFSLGVRNTLYDSVLGLEMIVVRTTEQPQRTLGMGMRIINTWVAARKFPLAPEETEVVALTKESVSFVFPIQTPQYFENELLREGSQNHR